MRIGFVLADLFTGSSASLLPTVASMFPEDGDDTLIVFAGGRLRSNVPLEAIKNSVYRLVNPENLDGSIIWCSSLSGIVSIEDVLQEFQRMMGKPMVTINGKTSLFPRIPDVMFDAAEGSRFLTSHCINQHNARRIAYIRGPENHNSAQERFQAYLDVLAENGIPVDESIISDPVQWNLGYESMCQLLDGRGKVPGKDFDAVLFASDFMMNSAVKALDERGYRIPEDVIVCGFNDSLGSRILDVPATTVRLPYAAVGKNVVSAVRAMHMGKGSSDKLLPMLPVIRRSCGCPGFSSWQGIGSVQEFSSRISDNFSINQAYLNHLMESVLRNTSDQNVGSLLDELISNDADVYEITDIMQVLGRFCDEESRKNLSDKTRSDLPFVMDRFVALSKYRERNQRTAISQFNNDLLEANTVTDIASILESSSQELGFDKMLLVIGDGEMSHLVGYDKSFPENRLVPENLDSLLDPGTWIALPLCTETEDMGHLLMKPKGLLNGVLSIEIRGAVSRALKSALLFEETRKAQKSAEEAEQARMNFFANLGENLRDPLYEIADMVSGSGLEGPVRDRILERITGASQMLDLSLSNNDELELNRFIDDIGAVLSSFGCYDRESSAPELPCILMDEARIRQALGILVSSMGEGARIRADLHRRGVRIEISDETGLWKPSRDDVGLSLVQRIFILHGGSCSANDGSFVVYLPYPTLSGSVSRQWEEGAVLACINEIPEIQIPGIECEKVNGTRFAEKKRLPSTTGAVFWDSGFKGYNALSGLLGLVSNESYRNLPVLCFGFPRSKTLEDSIRASVEANGRTVLQIGSQAEEFMRWLQEPEILSCDLNNAVSMYRRNEPALVILSIDEYVNVMPAVQSFLNSIRSLKRVSMSPVIICADYIDQSLLDQIGDMPNLLIVSSCILDSDEFAMRVRAILGGSPLLAASTAAIVKKVQSFICTHATLPLSRWQIAEEVHVSEDYLARIFKKELGLSPWDYLNRYRVWLATRLLRNTGMSVNDVAVATGFQDQAYFCRVYKKIRGFSPSKIRSSKKLLS